MESKKRLFIAFSITVILLAALFTSFGRHFFASTNPKVTLPVLTAPTEEHSTPLEESNLQRIELSQTTVQAVIAQLQTNNSYYRNFTTTVYWSEFPEDSYDTVLEVWSVGHLTQVKKTLPSAVRYDILYDGTLYSWYEGDQNYWTQTPQIGDLYQMIPNYQSITDLPQEDILRAGYEYRNGIPCIYVEASSPPLYHLQCFWIQAETGLLLAVESYDNGQLVYTMDGFSPISPYESSLFYLPDGTTLQAWEIAETDP